LRGVGVSTTTAPTQAHTSKKEGGRGGGGGGGVSKEPYQIATPWALQHSTHAINPPRRSKPKAAGRNSEEEECGGNDLRASRQPRLSRSLWFGYSIRLAQQYSFFPLVASLKPLVPVHT